MPHWRAIFVVSVSGCHFVLNVAVLTKDIDQNAQRNLKRNRKRNHSCIMKLGSVVIPAFCKEDKWDNSSGRFLISEKTTAPIPPRPPEKLFSWHCCLVIVCVFCVFGGSRVTHPFLSSLSVQSFISFRHVCVLSFLAFPSVCCNAQSSL